MSLTTSRPEATPPAARPSADVASTSVTLGAYLAAVATAVAAGMPQRSWVEATVAASKPSPYGYSLQLVDPAGGSSAPTMRAFVRTADRDAIARRLGAPLDPVHLVGLTTVLQIEPEYHVRWGMGGRVVGLSKDLRQSLMLLALEDVRARLKAERLYDRQRRLPTPDDVVRIAVVHPAGAAGHADIATELARWERAGIIGVTSTIAAFEGPRAATEIATALRRAASGDGVPPDVVLMVRGGGDKAGLLALDEEAVARAVCLCPVQVIAGLGHQVDSSLVDEVAAVTCHTPSKALAHVAGLIARPARRARVDMATAMTEAERRLTAADHGLEAARQAVATAAERRVHAADAALAAAEVKVATVTAGAGERCARLGAEADRLYEAVRTRAPAHLDETERSAQRAVSDGMAAGRRRLNTADDGRAAFGAVLTRATARLDAAAAEVAHRQEAVSLDTARRLTDAGVDLSGLGRLVESLGFDSTLGRGFALATRLDGTLVPTRAAALAADNIVLTFADGAVTARVGAALTITITGKAA